jgi:hypothetical protein
MELNEAMRCKLLTLLEETNEEINNMKGTLSAANEDSRDLSKFIPRWEVELWLEEFKLSAIKDAIRRNEIDF